MSKQNIVKTEHLDDGKTKRTRLTFKTDTGEMIYEYSGHSANAVRRGSDPAGLMGKLISHKKPEVKKTEKS